MTFTISQTPDSQNLYLYPNADITVGLTRSESGNNYKCVDEVWSTPSDTDYVYTTNILAKYDYYGLPNHTSESGTINYVKVVTRAKGYLYNQSSSGTYKLGISNGTDKSWGYNEAPLSTSYNKYYHNFTSTPSGAAWTWAAIDTLNIAIQCSSPTIIISTYLVLYPSAAGTYSSNTPVGEINNYNCVDEVIADDDTTYVTATVEGIWRTDTYNFPNHTTETGTIKNVTVYIRGKKTDASGLLNATLYIGGSLYIHPTPITPSYNYTSYSWMWTYNPSTSVAWVWDDIDNIEAGLRQIVGRTTQCYIIVNYEEPEINPQIRTSQCYAVVNYTPSTTTVTLNLPESLSVSHGRNIERFLFPAGDYEVIDTGRASKTLQLTGYETASSASTTMEALKDMCHYSKYVSIAGLPDQYLNTDYYITNFSFENVFNSQIPKYKYSLTLEES